MLIFIANLVSQEVAPVLGKGIFSLAQINISYRPPALQNQQDMSIPNSLTS